MGVLDDIFSSTDSDNVDPTQDLSNIVPTDEVGNILNNPDTNPDAAKMAMSVYGLQRSLAENGVNPNQAEPRTSMFGKILDVLAAPGEGVRGVIDTALNGELFGTDASTGQSIGTGFERGIQRKTTTSDILRENNVVSNPIARGALGFAGDVLTDPLTYLTFGGSAEAQVGGKVLTGAGQMLHGLASENLLANGITDGAIYDKAINDTFSGVARYQSEAKNLAKAGTDSERALAVDNLSKASDSAFNFQTGIKPDQVIGQELFEKPALQVGITLPFLGHFMGAANTGAKELAVDAAGKVGGEISAADNTGGIVNKTLRAASTVFKPGTIDFGRYDWPTPVVDAVNNVRLYANQKLADLGSVIDKAKSLPVLGPVVKGADDIVGKTVQIANKTSDLFNSIFNRKAIIGESAHNAEIQYFNAKAGAHVIATEKAFNVIDDIAPGMIKDKDTQREIALAIDGQAMKSAQKTRMLEYKAKGIAPNTTPVIDTINKIRSAGVVTEGDQLLFRDAALSTGAEDDFRSGIENLYKDPNVDPLVKTGVQKVMKAFDDLTLEESNAGLGGYSRLEYYLTHRYLNANTSAAESGGKMSSFLEGRKYASLADAYNISGKVGDTDLASLLQYRYQKSLTLRAQRDYWNRLVIENGMNPDLVTNVYKEALANPGGSADQLMKRYRMDISPIDSRFESSGRYIAEREKVYAGVGLKDPDASRLVALNASDFEQKINMELNAAGKSPLDKMVPQGSLGEIGEKVKIPGGTQEVWMPKAVADAFRETVAGKDIVKEALSGSAFGRATLSVLDHAQATFKKFSTLPFPAYWGQNFLGDRFNQAMQGVHAYDPGIMARTFSLLSGKTAIKSPNGFVMDRPALVRIMKQFGFNYSVDEMLGTTEAFGKMNIDRFLAKKNNTLWQNISGGNIGAALEQTQDKMQKGFDGLFRLNHFIHRFEQGDTITDAVNAANNAYFNYRDLSPVEQSVMRRFFFFYSYMSKATKQTLTNLVSAPGNITMQLHGVNALADMFRDPNSSPTLEQYDSKLLGTLVNQEQLSRVIGKDAQGNAIVARGFAAPLNSVMSAISWDAPRNYTVGEMVDSVKDSAIRTIQKSFAGANPAINLAAQQISGKNLYFDKPLNSDFLRKLPDLTEAAKALSGFAHTDLPTDINETAKKFLNAVPDGKGRLIADPGKMWILTNLIPGMGRTVSSAGALSNENLTWKQAILRNTTGINISDNDPSKSYLGTEMDKLNELYQDRSVGQMKKNRELEYVDKPTIRSSN